jgi:antitoxin PrlF
MAAIVTSKGQVTIPKRVRDLLRIEPGSKVEFERAPDGRVVLVKVDSDPRPSRFARLRGHAGKGLSDRRHHCFDARRELVTLVDTNVLLDLVTDDPDRAEWSIATLEAAALKGPLCIKDVV